MLKKSSRVVMILFLVLAAGIIFSGCAKEAPKETQEAARSSEPMARVVFIVKAIDSIYWETMLKGAKEAGEDLNIDVEGFGPLKAYDVEEQLRFIENAITKKVDALIIVPADSRGIIPGIEKANAAGIPIINPNTRIMGGEVVTFLGYGNTKAAYDAGAYLLSKIDKNDPKIIILEGKPSNQITVELNIGFNQAIADSGKNGTVLASQTASLDIIDAQNGMEK